MSEACVNLMQHIHVFSRHRLALSLRSCKRFPQQLLAVPFVCIDPEITPNANVRTMLAEFLTAKTMECSDECAFRTIGGHRFDTMPHLVTGFICEGQS